MIKKFIRKLFGQDSAPAEDTPSAEAEADETGSAPARHAAGASGAGKTRRKPARGGAAVKTVPDPDVPVIIPHDVHGID
ncbi:polynucleotide adenylyltransferase PcnB, partial [Burkholderia sp. SIMBA_052]